MALVLNITNTAQLWYYNVNWKILNKRTGRFDGEAERLQVRVGLLRTGVTGR